LGVVDARHRGVTLAEARPDLAGQWHPGKNGALTPDDVAAGTHQVVWWVAACGHDWDMPVKSRTGPHGSGCPYCAGKRVLASESLAAERPDLASEWHPDRNDGLRPDALTIGSGKPAWWRCRTCGHEWVAPVVRRARAGTGCPACAGQVVAAGKSFADTFPEIAAEWHPERNGNRTPDTVTPFSGVKAWWCCAGCGREWQAVVRDRAAGKGCSTCQPPGWSQVAVRLGAELATLFDVGDLERSPREVRTEVGWEPDIVLPAQRIALDVDGRFWHGDTHHKTRTSLDRDTRKSAAFREAGWRLIRIREAPLQRLTDDDIVVADLRDTKTVTLAVAEHLITRFGMSTEGLDSYRASDGLVATAISDAVIVAYQRGAVAGRTLAELFPDLASQWHPERNGVLTPTTVFAGSGRKVWWLCSLGHEWLATLLSRSQGSACPYCSGNKAGQGNTLGDRFPDLAAEWYSERNGDLTAWAVTPGTRRKVWWCCASGHDWQASIASRVAGRGCPYCSGYRASAGNNLGVANPELAAQWHPERNWPLTAEQVTPGSKRRVWWQCSRGHEWQAPVANRKAGRGCPYCSGRAVGQGNTLGDRYPELAAQWHTTRNGKLAPGQVTPRSGKQVWWLCSQGHEWEAVISVRADGAGCPDCTRRVKQGKTLSNMHPALAEEWHPDSNGALRPDEVASTSTRAVWWRCERGHKWRSPVRSRVDGSGCPYCAGRLATPEHNLAVLKPRLTTEWHPSKNEQLTAQDVTPGSDRKVWWRCEEGHEWEATIANRVRGNSCPYCSGHRVGQGNSLADRHPELTAQWHPSRNGLLTPEQVTPGLSTRVWWNCPAGHEWQASINSRVRGTGCPFCTGRRATRERNLKSVHPELAAEWHPTKNGDLDPAHLSPRSAQRVWWECAQGHEWSATVLNRSGGSGCPYCSGRRVTPDRTLAILRPDLAAQWHSTRNIDLRPDDVSPGSGKRAWWQCSAGHEWQAAIGSRTSGAGCPRCSRTKPSPAASTGASTNETNANARPR
jgi:hypothetical protein